MPDTIGRFIVERPLGRGAQGSVWLASDPKLKRTVAIKTIEVRGRQSREQLVADAMREAQSVSRLQHPNIVALFDAGEHEGAPFLVFEYVEGRTLSTAIQEDGSFSPARAAELARQVLAGLTCAHEAGVIHRDIKPGNIILTRDGVPRIMDFGIAGGVIDASEAEPVFAGTPRYCAPEVFEGQASAASDLYAVGMTLYEMLAGRPALSASTLTEAVYQAAHGQLTPPSQHNPDVDEKLDAIVLRAVARTAEERYASSGDMASALADWLTPQETTPEVAGANQSTLDFLFRRMRHKADFPALSEAIRALNRLARADEEHITELSTLLLRDYSLTNKILKLVNTAFYGQYGGISTISRAITILGFDTVRNIALALVLFDNMQNKAQAGQLRDEVMSGFLGGVIGRQLAEGHGSRLFGEEAFICALFQNLGRLLTMFYFHDEYTEIERLMAQGQSAEKASAHILGVTFDQLAQATTKYWNFPDKVQRTLLRFGSEKAKKPGSEGERLRVLANLSHELRQLSTDTPLVEKQKALRALSARYESALGCTPDQLSRTVETSLKTFSAEIKALNLDPRASKAIGRARHWAGDETSVPDTSDNDLPESAVMQTNPGSPLPPSTARSAEGPPENAEAALASGIQDITNTLVGEYRLNDLLRMILETMIRGMDFGHAVLCLRDAKRNAMVARFGLGESVDDHVRSLRFPMAGAPNVFQLALQKNLDIFIQDTADEKLAAHIPDWYRKGINAPAFLLLPITIDRKPVGLLYADYAKACAGQLDQKAMSMLKTLRNQAVLAIKQKLI